MPIAEPRRDDVMTDYGTLNRLYPQTVTYKVDNKNYILMEDEMVNSSSKKSARKGNWIKIFQVVNSQDISTSFR